MIHWDHNAGSPLRPSARAALERALADDLGNPSSVHALGRRARAHLDGARELIAQAIGAEPSEIALVGSGSEASALALKGSFARAPSGRRRIVSSTLEHPSVLFALEQLEELGAEVVRVPPTAQGRVDAAAMIGALTPDTFLCSLMWANNETGVVQPFETVARACRERGVLFHTDAVQAFGKLPVSLRNVPCDLLSLSGHKFGAPSGTGALYAARGVGLSALVAGHQEKGRRGGTPNAALWASFRAGLTEALAAAPLEFQTLSALRDRFESAVMALAPTARIHGVSEPRLPQTSNIAFKDADGEALLIALDLAGIAVSTGAACASGTLRPSHVLTAMGLSAKEAQSSLRFSLGWSTQARDVDEVLHALKQALSDAQP